MLLIELLSRAEGPACGESKARTRLTLQRSQVEQQWRLVATLPRLKAGDRSSAALSFGDCDVSKLGFG